MRVFELAIIAYGTMETHGERLFLRLFFLEIKLKRLEKPIDSCSWKVIQN